MVTLSVCVCIQAIQHDAAVNAMGFADGLALFLMPPLLTYLHGKLNDEKPTRINPEVKAQAASNPSPENIRLTAARLKESPLQITNRLSPRTGRRYIVVGGERRVLTPPWRH